MILDPDKYEHGTRARYVAGCRCDACRAANRARYRERAACTRAASADVKPSGPALPGIILRAGRAHHILRCPGANGEPCVRDGAWLRGKHTVCSACVERATVWNGFVSATPARMHLLALRAQGVGYRSVALASDVALSTITRVLRGTLRKIRANSERRILAVDAGAVADHGLVDAHDTQHTLEQLRAEGYTGRQLASLLGYTTNAPKLGQRRITAKNRQRIARLANRVRRDAVEPARVSLRAKRALQFLRTLLRAGAPRADLSERLGFDVHDTLLARTTLPVAKIEKIDGLQHEVLDALREDQLPKTMQWGGVGGIEDALRTHRKG